MNNKVYTILLLIIVFSIFFLRVYKLDSKEYEIGEMNFVFLSEGPLVYLVKQYNPLTNSRLDLASPPLLII